MLANFLSLVAAVVVAGPAPTPAPAPSAQPTLPEIGRIRIVSPCETTLVHANAAIASALHNDVTFSRSIAHLRTVDLDSDPLTRANGLHVILNYSRAIHDESVAGNAEITELRAIAASDPKKNVELKAFADALGGALGRQKKFAERMLQFMTIVQGRASSDDAYEMIGGHAILDHHYYARTNSTFARLRQAGETFHDLARSAADELQLGITEIDADEGVAAEHAQPAASLGC